MNSTTATANSSSAGTTPAVLCPTCHGPTYDNRAENDARLARGEKLRPDYRCRDASCGGAIWRAKSKAPRAQQPNGKAPAPTPAAPTPATAPAPAPAPTTPAAGAARLREIFRVQELCWTHALSLAATAEAKGVTVTLDGLSALTAQALIAYLDRDR